MSEVNTTASNTAASPAFEVVPAKIKVKIGKRARYFDDTEAGHKEAREALDHFNNGGARQNKGIMAARIAAKALKEKVMAPILAYTSTLELSDKGKVQRANVLYELFTAFPAAYPIVCGCEMPVSDEGEGQGATENVDPEANTEAVSEPIVDPLSELA